MIWSLSGSYTMKCLSKCSGSEPTSGPGGSADRGKPARWGLVVLLSAAFLPVVVSAGQQGPAAPPEELGQITEMSLEELLSVDVATDIATPGNPRPLAQAPAVANVVTAEQIEALGATHLAEVLETLPGFHVSASQLRPDPIYSVRGIHSQNNAQILLLVDGVPVVSSVTGGPLITYRMPVSNIARIEVIRGPGSAIYGADAFAGVINILSKDHEELEQPEAGLRLGSFGERALWYQRGGKIGAWDYGFGIEWQTGDGDPGRIVESDQQTILDERIGTRASLAPGPLSNAHEVVDTHLHLSRKHWHLHFWGWRLGDGGTFAGSAQALDSAGSFDSQHLLGEVRWNSADKLENWSLESRASFLYLDQVVKDLTLFPPGTRLPIGRDGNVDFEHPVGLVDFPEGLIGSPSAFERTASFESSATYVGGESHRFRLAGGVVRTTLDTRQLSNFGPGVIDGTQPVVGGELSDVTDTLFTTLADQSRVSWNLSFEDAWRILPTLELVAGLRYDHYSDFDGTWNPRLVLLYTPREDCAVKLLYGSAFRAPSFVELFVRNNPVNLGNPDLEPETLETLELAMDYRPGGGGLRLALNLFAYVIDDMISLVPDSGATTRTHQNADQQEATGAEFELEWRPTSNLRLVGNLAWQRAKDRRTGAPVADAPRRQGFLGAHFDLGNQWNLGLRLDWIADRPRAQGDSRPPLDDDLLLGLTLAKKGLGAGRWDAAVTVRNLFDEDARNPSLESIRNDYPVEGRTATLELRYRL